MTVGSMLVGIDVGTTSTKVVVADRQWRIRGRARQEYPIQYLGDTGAQQDPLHWWEAASGCVKKALAAAGISAGRVAAVGVSSQAPSLVALDAAGEPVRPAVLWLDRRGQAECDRRVEAADSVLALTGNRMDSYYAAPKLAWLLRTEPRLRERVAAVVMANGFIVQRLTGRVSIDSGHAGLSLLNDLRTGDWSPTLTELWQIPPRWLPAIVEPDTVVGTVHAAAAAATGLATGTPVVAGLVDGAAASLESGVLTDGDVGEMTGQSTVINAAVSIERATRSATGALSVMPYVSPGHHLVFGSMVSTGGILAWFRDQFGVAGEEDFAALDALAGTASPGSGDLVMLPYFLGERSPVWDAQARGAVVGLSMSTTRAQLVRAILEGTAYGLAHNLDALADFGVNPQVLRVVGGGAAGNTWNQIKADVTGLTIELPGHAMGAPVGVAMVAAAGVGMVDDLVDAARQRLSIADTITPDRQRHRDYRHRYQVYRRLYPALREVNNALARLRGTTDAADAPGLSAGKQLLPGLCRALSPTAYRFVADDQRSTS